MGRKVRVMILAIEDIAFTQYVLETEIIAPVDVYSTEIEQRSQKKIDIIVRSFESQDAIINDLLQNKTKLRNKGEHR